MSLLSVNIFAQIKSSRLKDFQMTKPEHQEFKDYLLSKNLKLKDTIFIKYDFKNEECWDRLDSMPKDHIWNVIAGFQKDISNFNELYTNAVAYNFKEPGKGFNKLKIWDNTILIDDKKVLRKLLFKNKALCGCSAVILADGSYLIYERDPHFELLSLHHNYSGEKF